MTIHELEKIMIDKGLVIRAIKTKHENIGGKFIVTIDEGRTSRVDFYKPKFYESLEEAIQAITE